jgi:hypothetical protein
VQLEEFRQQVPNFNGLSETERIKLLVWFLHKHEGRERVDVAAVRKCYEQLNYEPSNLSRDCARLAERTPRELLKDGKGYRLEARARSVLDLKYGDAESSIAVAKLLTDLPSRVPSLDESAFLGEALSCYKVKAFRATIVMVWNLAFDHLLHWLLADAARLQTFNTRIPVRYPKKKDARVMIFDDFEDLKESEIIEIASSAGLLAGGISKVLHEKLTRRNIAAHPSSVVVTQYQTEDAITDLVYNVVLKLQ